MIMENPDNEEYGGIILNYTGQYNQVSRVSFGDEGKFRKSIAKVSVGIIGCGNFTQGVILPVLGKIKDVDIKAIASGTGKTAQHVAQKYQCQYCATDYKEILDDQDINAVFITTRHHLHAKMVCEALKRGKHVFVEKPLCLDQEELKEIVQVYESLGNDKPMLVVGFNRRFSAGLSEIQKKLAVRSTPLMMQYRVNAGYIPSDHWVHDPNEGGGRIIGEVCHFVDALQYIIGSAPVKVYATRLPSGGKVFADDNVNVVIDFADGSSGTILYTALGDKKLGKEYIEIFGDGKSFVIDDFKRGAFKGQDKGHGRECADFILAISKGIASPIPFQEIVLSTLTTLNIEESLRTGSPVKIDSAELL